jgi:HK97 gp10 family phage protein
MMGKITFKIEGKDKLITKFGLMSKKVKKEVPQVVKKHTYQFETRAKKGAPFITGYLKRSIGSGFYKNGLTGTVAIGANYGVYVVLGTRYQDAQSDFWYGNFIITKKAFLKDLERITKVVVK